MAEIINRKCQDGCWVEINRKTVKNLGWLFKHASSVTELHFDKITDHVYFGEGPRGYVLRAYMTDGRQYQTLFASHSIFCDVFNPNRKLRGIAVFSNFGDMQYVGELKY